MRTTFTLANNTSLRIQLALLLCLFTGIAQSQVPVLWSCSGGGGRNGFGSIFKINADGTGDTVVHQFELNTGGQPNSMMMAGDNSKFYGVCTFQGLHNQSGAIFSLDPVTRTYTDMFDFDYMSVNGGVPYTNVAQAGNGVLYGTNSQDNGTGFGMIYAFNPANSQYQSVFHFDPLTYFDGNGPMVASDGKVYGSIKSLGGCYAAIYCINPANNSITMYPFDTTGNCMCGKDPQGNLLEAEPGILYGACRLGGDKNCGTLFSFNMQSHAINRLFSLDTMDGIRPGTGALTAGHDGKVYGTTYAGGAYDAGVVYSVDTATHAFTKLADFHDTLGVTPQGTLLLASDGKLYGTTISGGDQVDWTGTMFSFDRTTHQIHPFKNIHSTDSIGYGVAGFIEYGTQHAVTGITKPAATGVTFELIPNPAKDQVVIAVPETLLGKPMMVTDMVGEAVFISTASNSITKLDCSNWSAGVYFVNVEGAVAVKKLIVTH